MNHDRTVYPYDLESNRALWFVVDVRTKGRLTRHDTQASARTSRDKRNLEYWATVDANARSKV